MSATLADAEEVSALVIVEQLAGGTTARAMSRIRGGTERLIAALARRLRGYVLTDSVVRGLRPGPSGVRVAVEHALGRRFERRADCVVMTAPPSLRGRATRLARQGAPRHPGGPVNQVGTRSWAHGGYAAFPPR